MKIKTILLILTAAVTCSCLVERPQQSVPASPAAALPSPTASSAADRLTSPTPLLAGTSAGWWRPTPGMTWQWDLSDPPVDTALDADVYDIDLFDSDPSVIADLHRAGRKVICYVSVGSVEDWRPDKDQFPAEVIGKDYQSWPGEKWLDIRRLDLIGPIMQARLDLCREKGFDAVEPDNMQVADNDTGFPITLADQLAYSRWLAEEAHSRGLAIGMKNDPEQVVDLVGLFDFAITEDCFDQGWCEEMTPLIQAGKTVFAAEYTDTGLDFTAACKAAQTLGFSLILKNRDLDSYRGTCP